MAPRCHYEVFRHFFAAWYIVYAYAIFHRCRHYLLICLISYSGDCLRRLPPIAWFLHAAFVEMLFSGFTFRATYADIEIRQRADAAVYEVYLFTLRILRRRHTLIYWLLRADEITIQRHHRHATTFMMFATSDAAADAAAYAAMMFTPLRWCRAYAAADAMADASRARRLSISLRYADAPPLMPLLPLMALRHADTAALMQLMPALLPSIAPLRWAWWGCRCWRHWWPAIFSARCAASPMLRCHARVMREERGARAWCQRWCELCCLMMRLLRREAGMRRQRVCAMPAMMPKRLILAPYTAMLMRARYARRDARRVCAPAQRSRVFTLFMNFIFRFSTRLYLYCFRHALMSHAQMRRRDDAIRMMPPRLFDLLAPSHISAATSWAFPADIFHYLAHADWCRLDAAILRLSFAMRCHAPDGRLRRHAAEFTMMPMSVYADACRYALRRRRERRFYATRLTMPTSRCRHYFAATIFYFTPSSSTMPRAAAWFRATISRFDDACLLCLLRLRHDAMQSFDGRLWYYRARARYARLSFETDLRSASDTAAISFYERHAYLFHTPSLHVYIACIIIDIAPAIFLFFHAWFSVILAWCFQRRWCFHVFTYATPSFSPFTPLFADASMRHDRVFQRCYARRLYAMPRRYDDYLLDDDAATLLSRIACFMPLPPRADATCRLILIRHAAAAEWCRGHDAPRLDEPLCLTPVLRRLFMRAWCRFAWCHAAAPPLFRLLLLVDTVYLTLPRRRAAAIFDMSILMALFTCHDYAAAAFLLTPSVRYLRRGCFAAALFRCRYAPRWCHCRQLYFTIAFFYSDDAADLLLRQFSSSSRLFSVTHARLAFFIVTFIMLTCWLRWCLPFIILLERCPPDYFSRADFGCHGFLYFSLLFFALLLFLILLDIFFAVFFTFCWVVFFLHISPAFRFSFVFTPFHVFDFCFDVCYGTRLFHAPTDAMPSPSARGVTPLYAHDMPCLFIDVIFCLPADFCRAITLIPQFYLLRSAARRHTNVPPCHVFFFFARLLLTRFAMFYAYAYQDARFMLEFLSCYAAAIPQYAITSHYRLAVLRHADYAIYDIYEFRCFISPF